MPAAEVLEDGLAAVDLQPGVAPGDARRAEVDGRLVAAAQQVAPLHERGELRSRLKAVEERVRLARLRHGVALHRRSGERVAEG